jgi:hypothetical protein
MHHLVFSLEAWADQPVDQPDWILDLILHYPEGTFLVHVDVVVGWEIGITLRYPPDVYPREYEFTFRDGGVRRLLVETCVLVELDVSE